MPTTTPFLEILHAYFRGEKLATLGLALPFGLVLVAGALWFARADRTPFGWGLAAPLVLLGVVLAGVGLAVGLRTDGQVAALVQAYTADPATFVGPELSRMHKVNANWPILTTAWVAFIAVGLALRFFVHREWTEGLALGLVFLGGVGFLFDGVAERRARPYTVALEHLATGAAGTAVGGASVAAPPQNP